MACNIIVIYGPPKTGKTTLANALCERLPKCRRLEIDYSIVSGFEWGVLSIPEGHENNYWEVIGQFIDFISDQDREKLCSTIIRKITNSTRIYNSIVTCGYFWNFECHQQILKDYKNVCFVSRGNGYRSRIKINDATVDVEDIGVYNLAEKIIDVIRQNAIKQILPIFGKYQQFDFLPYGTSSHTIEKLTALNLFNDMTGKRILDVGCNNGFFTIECDKRGARESIGIDNAEQGIAVADVISKSIYFCRNTKFYTMEVNDNIERLGKFDLILCLSMIHYVDKQEDLIKRLLGMLAPKGELILEMGIHQGNENEIKDVNGKYYPTFNRLQTWVEGYNFINVPSVNQAGDDIPRQVITIYGL